MRSVVLSVLALSLSFSAPALAGDAPPAQGAAVTAPGSIAGGKVAAFDPAKKTMTVDANGQKITLDISKANIAGEIKVNAIVDVTHANGAATNIAVRPPPGAQGGAQASGGQATAPGAIAGGKVIAFDATKRLMTVEANGQKVDILLGNAVVNGEVKVGAIVDVAFAAGAPAAVNVRP